MVPAALMRSVGPLSSELWQLINTYADAQNALAVWDAHYGSGVAAALKEFSWGRKEP